MRYDPHETEEQVLKFWQEQRIYEKVKEKNAKGKKFYFLQGPPYTSGRIHIGHAWNNALKDIVLRYKRMQGFDVWDRAGYDMHGLPVENKVQEMLGIKEKKEILSYGIAKFVEKCKELAMKNAELMNQDLWRVGVWLDYNNAYMPITREFIEGEWWFIKLAFEQGRLYKGKKIMHWCASCETSLAKHELEYKKVKENSIFVKLKIKGKDDEYLVVWTTTPWTLAFNLGIMVNPELDYVKVIVEHDGREEKWIIAKALANMFLGGLLGKSYKIVEEFKGKELEGIEYVPPFYEELDEIYNEIKKRQEKAWTVLLSAEYVDLSAGTGLVHCAPGCGPEDHEVGKKYGLEAFNRIDERGIFYDMQEFSGLKAKEDDAKFIERLRDKGLLIAETEVEHDYAHCWRCKNPVVFRPTEQWFLRLEDLRDKLLELNKDVYWHPKFAKKNYELWTESLRDNSITRQRFWGTPVPIWECSCGNIEVIGSIKELEEKAGELPEDLHRPYIDEITIKCNRCGKDMKRVPDVIDVWIDSGTTSWNCLDWPQNKELLAKLFPADLVLEATEQIKLWFSMLQICSAIAFNRTAYKNVYVHGMILDWQGMKMSKSLGNVVSPFEVIDKYGADTLRYYLCETDAGENANFSWQAVETKHRNLNVLWNIQNYVYDLASQLNLNPEELSEKDVKLGIEECYILSRMNSTIKKVTALFERYRIDDVIPEIERLFLELSRGYIQLVRDKAAGSNDEKKTVLYTTYVVYKNIVKMFATVAPFITEAIWQNLREKFGLREESVHLCEWPKSDNEKINEKLEKEVEHAKRIIEVGMAERDKHGIGLRWPLKKATITLTPEVKLSKEILELVKKQLNVKEIEIQRGKALDVALDTQLTPELEAEGFAREVARHVQIARKKAGLVKTDKIKLEVECSEVLAEKLKKFEEMLKERTNAEEVIFKNLDKWKHEGKIRDEEIKINFEKI